GPCATLRRRVTRIQALTAISVALACTLLLAACGAGGTSEDPQQVLHDTFSNPTPIQSGTFDLDVRIDGSGGTSSGKLEVKLGGKFRTRGARQFPLFDFDVSLHGEGGAQSFNGSGGLTSTGSQAFLKFQGTEYAVPQSLYRDFVTSYAQLQNQNKSQSS